MSAKRSNFPGNYFTSPLCAVLPVESPDLFLELEIGQGSLSRSKKDVASLAVVVASQLAHLYRHRLKLAAGKIPSPWVLTSELENSTRSSGLAYIICHRKKASLVSVWLVSETVSLITTCG